MCTILELCDLQFTPSVLLTKVSSQISSLPFKARSLAEVSVAKPTAAQLSTASLSNGAGTVQFPPAKNGATRGSSYPKVHAELAYLCAIGSSDIKDAHTYGNSLIRQLTHSCWGKKRRH